MGKVWWGFAIVKRGKHCVAACKICNRKWLDEDYEYNPIHCSHRYVISGVKKYMEILELDLYAESAYYGKV